MIKIYTKTGDKGSTSLFGGDTVSKQDPLIETIGAVDECNSALGLALCQFSLEEALDPIKEQLIEIQKELFELGAHIASAHVDGNIQEGIIFDEHVTQLEKWIDKMEKRLPQLRHFILPGGDPGGASLHLARSICRRAERRVAPLIESENISPSALIYLNRLSDYLFVVARLVNRITHSPETPWKPRKKSQSVT